MQASIHFTARDLAEAFRVPQAVANEAHAWLHAAREKLEEERGWTVDGAHPSHFIGSILEDISEILGGHGAEGFLFEGSDEGLQYINRGDAYDRTLVWADPISGFELTSWGSWVEHWESENN